MFFHENEVSPRVMDSNKKEINILIVDDDIMVLTLLSSILKENGYSTLHAFNGVDAMKIMSSKQVDLLLLDVVMPKIDGFELIKKMRNSAEYAQIPVIFISSSDNTEFIVKGFNEGAVDYVIKPFKKTELISRIKFHLKNKAKQDQITSQLEELRKSNRYLLQTIYQLSKTIQ